MPHVIVKLEGRYFEWTTVADGPTTEPMTLEEFKRWYAKEYGPKDARHLPKRLARVEAHGTSLMVPSSARELLAHNQAGPGGKHLPLRKLRAWARRGGGRRS